MLVDYVLAGKKWAGPRPGWNVAGWVSWAIGFVVGIAPLVGIGNVPAAPLVAFIVGAVVYFALGQGRACSRRPWTCPGLAKGRAEGAEGCSRLSKAVATADDLPDIELVQGLGEDPSPCFFVAAARTAADGKACGGDSGLGKCPRSVTNWPAAQLDKGREGR